MKLAIGGLAAGRTVYTYTGQGKRLSMLSCHACHAIPAENTKRGAMAFVGASCLIDPAVRCRNESQPSFENRLAHALTGTILFRSIAEECDWPVGIFIELKLTL